MNTERQNKARQDNDQQPGELTRRSVLRLSGLTGAGILAPGLLAACWGASNANYEATIADARTAITQALSDTDTPSISVALIDRERVIWAEACGVIDKTSQAAPTTDTLFCIGSCSKVVSTVAVMLLVDRGLIRLDEPLVTYLPDFRMVSPEYTRITVRMLLSHSSGLPGADYRVAFLQNFHADLVAHQTLETLSMSRLKHAPGEMATYCNDGFTLLEPLLQQVTGRSFTQFVADDVLGPLGMRNSRYSLAPFPVDSYAPGYEGNHKLPFEFVGSYATGGLYTTPTDMSRLARMLLNGGLLDGQRLLRAQSVADMGRNQLLDMPLRGVDPTDDFGLGWDSVQEDGIACAGVQAWQKNGGTLTYSTDFFVAPEAGLSVIVSGASTHYGSRALSERILLNALVEGRQIAAIPTAEPIVAEAAPVGASPSLLNGLYAHFNGMFKVQVQDDQSVTLIPYSIAQWQTPSAGLTLGVDGSFADPALPDQAYRVTSLDGQRYLVSRARHGLGLSAHESVCGQAMQGKATLSPAWQARLPRRWLAVNQLPDSFLLAIPWLRLDALDELPGYIFLSAPCINTVDQITDASHSDSLATMCLKIPYDCGRDLNDVVIEQRAGEEWVRVGSSVFRPAQSVPLLVVGSTIVAIGSESFTEWRALQAGPAALPLTISGATAWHLYDLDFKLLASGAASGQATLAVGTQRSYLMLFGAADALIAVRLG
jgi:CubicO group peptidase (beta-lactamase class C family)